MSTNADLNLFQVDKHIRKLDADLARFEADLKEKSSSSQQKGDSDSGKKRKSLRSFTITAVLLSSRTFVSDKNNDFAENCDVINTFNCSTMSIYGHGYYNHSQMSRMNAKPELS